MSHVAGELLVAWWAGELTGEAEAAVEEHLFGCAACTDAAARLGAITATLRQMVPPLVGRDTVARLAAEGWHIREEPVAPGALHQGRFRADDQLLLFRLDGLPLADATRVAVTLRPAGSPEVLAHVEDAPFQRSEGNVLLACQRHYQSLPRCITAEVHIETPTGTTTTAYTIDHTFDP